MFCNACPDAPLTKLSIAENMINLFFNLVSHIEISHLFVLSTLPDPIEVLEFSIFINLFFL